MTKSAISEIQPKAQAHTSGGGIRWRSVMKSAAMLWLGAGTRDVYAAPQSAAYDNGHSSGMVPQGESPFERSATKPALQAPQLSALANQTALSHRSTAAQTLPAPQGTAVADASASDHTTRHLMAAAVSARENIDVGSDGAEAASAKGRGPHSKRVPGRGLKKLRSRRVAINTSHVRPKQAHPVYEVVLSRHQEDVAWVFKLPAFWRITVYSTAPHKDYPPWPKGTHPQGDYQLVDIEPRDFGHEKVGYAHHLVSRYDTLADYTVFSPSYPLEQSPELIKLMNHPGMLSSVQTMSTRVTATFPPADIMEYHSQDPWFRSDRFSTRTLEPIYFSDPHINAAARDYAGFFNLTDGVNLLSHFFAKLGLEDWVPEEQEVGSFAYGSIFGVGRTQARQHRREVYEKLQLTLQEYVHTSMLAERAWLMMFGGCDYIDKAPERW